MATDITSTNGGDTYIRQDVPADIQGSNTGMSCQWYQPFVATNHSLLQFTLPATNLGTITGIKLFLYSTGGTGDVTDLTVYESSTTFNEGTICWNNQPSLLNGNPIATIQPVAITAGWYSWQLQGSGAGSVNPLSKTWGNAINLHLKFATESGATKNHFFNTKENASNKPYLEITYTSGSSSSVFILGYISQQ